MARHPDSAQSPSRQLRTTRYILQRLVAPYLVTSGITFVILRSEALPASSGLKALGTLMACWRLLRQSPVADG